jgi:hypothetical protein
VVFFPFYDPYVTLMLIGSLSFSAESWTHRNGALPPESITEAAISDHICSSPPLGVNQQSFSN